MYMQEQNCCTVKREEEFGRPVESIMRCEDFKSNFARRLSNRFISRSPSSNPRQDSALKLRSAESKNNETNSDNVPERIEPISQLSKNGNMEQSGEAGKGPDKTKACHSTMQHTEVAALHMEVETLRWQLAQTEANRQMHIALLNQIVTFLNRVKDHIECQKPECESMGEVKNISKERALPRSFNAADIPRSRSTVHVNKHLEYSLRSAKKLGSKKISKSISNFNGYKDCNSTWSHSKMSLTSESDHSQKITEEISRLITLANTVLSTKLPDLACNDVQNNSHIKIFANGDKNETQNTTTTNTMDLIEEDTTPNAFVIKSICNDAELHEDLPIPSSLVDASDNSIKEFIMPLGTLTCDMENDFAGLKLHKEQKNTLTEDKSKVKNPKTLLSNRRLDYNHTANNFIEDESGFSSMSSFQEIGIPIISIIPPSPCKEMGFIDGIPEVIEETVGKWKNEIELNKQTVKVFWV